MQDTSQQFSPLQQALDSLMSGSGVQPSNPAQAATQGQAVLPQNGGQRQAEQVFANLLQGAFADGGKFKYRGSVKKADSISPLETQGLHGIESQAVLQAIQNGADPGMLGQAAQWLGKNAFVGLCEKFVEQVTKGKTGLFPTAISAWDKQQHQSGLNGVKTGDAVYFGADPSNGNAGHAGVYTTNGNFISATNNGIQEYNIQNWEKATGQKLLGYVSQDSSTPPPARQQPPQQPQQPMIKPIQQPYQPGKRLNMKQPLQQIQPKLPQQQQQSFMQQQPKPAFMQKTSIPKAPMHAQAQGNPLQSILGMFG